MSEKENGKNSIAPIWTALKNAWLGYKIAKNKNQIAKQKKYAKIINKLKKELGKPEEKFAILGQV